MIKIAHIGDIHWGLGYPGPSPQSRFDDICRIMDWSADRIIEERCDLVLVAGDMYKDNRVFLDRASIEIKACISWLRKFSAAKILVVIISGTPSHDPVSAYELIEEMQINDVIIKTKPSIVPIWIDDEPINIACLPGMNRSSLVTQDEYRNMSPHQIHQVMSDRITQICHGLLSQCKEQEDTAVNILLSHITFDKADKGFQDLLMQHEPVLAAEAIDGFDLVSLGHIHRPQRVGNVFYCGSPERLSFNDEEIVPGFWIYEVDGGISSRFIETPARNYITECWEEWTVKGFIEGHKPGPGFKDAIARLKYVCDEATAKLLDRKALERALYDAGAYFVAEIKADIQRTDRVRDQEVTKSMNPSEALQKWAEQQETPPEEISVLQSMTAGLMEEVAS